MQRILLETLDRILIADGRGGRIGAKIGED